MRLAVRPQRLAVRHATRVRFKATAKRVAAAGVAIRFDGHVELTSAAGVAEFAVTPSRPKRYPVRATRPDVRPAALTLRAER